MKVDKNNPSLWKNKLKFPIESDNKYTRGHAVILGGIDGKLGAAKLSALSAMRSGAGLATICCNSNALLTYEVWATSVMIHRTETIEEFVDFVKDERVKGILLGPGCGVNERTKQIVLEALRLKKPCVLDADAITVFQKNPNELFRALHQEVVLTPHMGEFNRIFKLQKTDRLALALIASEKAGCSVLLKGSETIIASPSGLVIANTNAPACLATAGSGDVLAGIITGLMASGISSFDASCIGAWVHGEAGKICGVGMISEDLIIAIKTVMQNMLTS